MKRRYALSVTAIVSTLLSQQAWAQSVSTSAMAGSGRWNGGVARATAVYRGNGIGFADTRSRTGNINFARGLVVGVDRNGVSVSTSYALSPRRGAAVAGTTSMHIGIHGDVSTSIGQTMIYAGSARRVFAGSGAGRTAWTSTGGRAWASQRIRSFARSQHLPAGRAFSRSASVVRRHR